MEISKIKGKEIIFLEEECCKNTLTQKQYALIKKRAGHSMKSICYKAGDSLCSLHVQVNAVGLEEFFLDTTGPLFDEHAVHFPKISFQDAQEYPPHKLKN